jgi:integrase/recombinase XerD
MCLFDPGRFARPVVTEGREHEHTPLLMPVWWHAPHRPTMAIEMPAPMTRAALHTIVKSVFEQAALGLEAQGEVSSSRAQRLRAASAHWLQMANEVDLRHVRDTLGHASISTTSIYLHTEDDRRHQAIEAGHRLGWD